MMIQTILFQGLDQRRLYLPTCQFFKMHIYSCFSKKVILFNDGFLVYCLFCISLQLLPIPFVRNHGELFSKNVTLRASSGGSWVVKLEHVEDEKCYFKLGWPKFVEDFGLRVGEFLVFWLAGKSILDVEISSHERKISNHKSELESSDSDEEVEILSKDYAFTKHSHRG